MLAGQLDEAANLAALVKRDQGPQLEVAGQPLTAPASAARQILVHTVRRNLRRGASAYLIAGRIIKTSPDAAGANSSSCEPAQA